MCPTLSIAIPAYNRPKWLKRALESIIAGNDKELNEVEIIISDDSTIPECRIVAEQVLQEWNGKWKYIWNNPSLGMASNWNQLINLASGQYILILHDDDFLLPNAIPALISGIRLVNRRESVLLFGVEVVDQNERKIKKQSFSKQAFFAPEIALKNLLSNSSFVRFPAIVVSRNIYKKVGDFDISIGGTADFDMWCRIFSNHGFHCMISITSAYRVHSNALTDRMFNEEVIRRLVKIFSKIESSNLLSKNELIDHKSNFFNQFILAGVYRKIKQREFSEAKRVINLFNISELNDLKLPARWLLIRILLKMATLTL